jgi:hypothetical protein
MRKLWLIGKKTYSHLKEIVWSIEEIRRGELFE